MAPDATGAMRKIPDDARTEPGWALARFGDGGWWPAVERGLRDGSFDDEVVVADSRTSCAAPARPSPGSRPSRPRGTGDVIVRLAARLAAELGVPHSSSSRASRSARLSSSMANAVQQAANVRGAFRIVATPPPGTGVLLDDRRNSGWTLAMVGGQLRRAGAQRVMPLVLGTLT